MSEFPIQVRLYGRANGKTAAMERRVQEVLAAGGTVHVWGRSGREVRAPREDWMESNRDDWDRQVHDDEG